MKANDAGKTPQKFMGMSWNNLGLKIIGGLIAIIGLGGLTMLKNLDDSVKATNITMEAKALSSAKRDSVLFQKIDSVKDVINMQITQGTVLNANLEFIERRLELLENK